MSKNKELDDFDYFGNQQVVSDIDTLERVAQESHDTDLCQKVATFKRHKQRERFNLFIMFTFMLCSIYFVYDMSSELAYHFGATRAPIELGQADTVDINKLHHNDYVTIKGVTDYRAASIKRLRNLNPQIKEYRYFHLAGSRIFIEADSSRDILPMQNVTISGRVVDARIDGSFNSLLDFLKTKFLFNVGDNVRFIQVGQEPGRGQTPYLIVFLALTLIWGLNLFAYIRHRKQAARIIGPNMLNGARR